MDEFHSDKQRLMLNNLLGSGDLFSLCSPILRPEYFNPEFRPSVEFILEYYNKYYNIPSAAVIAAECGEKFDPTNVSNDEREYTANMVESFCVQKAVINEVILARDLIANGNYGEIVERLTDAVSISLHRDLGIDVLTDVKTRIEERQKTYVRYSTGWANVDDAMDGGIQPTELWLWSANSGGGKSVALSNLALALVAQSLDVLYVSLELQEDLIADRFETMITGWNKKQKLERITETAGKVESLKTQYGASIYVKYMEADVTCANDIRAYLKEFQVHHGKLPKVLIVDYLDIMGTNEHRSYDGNVSEKDKIVSTQLRAIGNNAYNPMIMASASQQNRSAIGETDLNQSHIAGGLSKVNTCDAYISIILTDAMRNLGIAQFAFLKTRSSGAVGSRVDMRWDPVRLMFSSTDSKGGIVPAAGADQESLDSSRERPSQESEQPTPKNEFEDLFEYDET